MPSFLCAGRHLRHVIMSALGVSLSLLTPAQAQTGSVSLSPFEDWTVSLSTPVIWGGLNSVTAGVSLNKTFPIGRLLAPSWGNWATPLGLGIGAQGFAPLSFERLYVGASAGLSHGFALGPHFIDYGLRYAPLVEVGLTPNAFSTGYHGVLANIGLHLQVRPGVSTLLGLQGGVYQPFSTGAQPIWVLQPLAGLNLAF